MRHNKDGEPKLCKLFGRFSGIVLLSVLTLHAGAFEDYKSSENESFKKYKDERDEAFNNYLKEQWQAYKEFAGESVYEKPKPKVIPKTTYVIPPSLGPKVIIEVKTVPKPIVVEKPIIALKPIVLEKPKELIAPIVQVPKKDINFLFYGSMLSFQTPFGLKQARFYPNTQEGIASFFDKAASSEYQDLIADIESAKTQLNLNDWGVYLLVNDISTKIFDKADDANLFSWFVFNKLGYAVKVGLANNHVVLLTYSKKIIYSTPNYTLNNKKFYALFYYNKSGVGSILTYNQDYPGSVKPLDLAIESLPNFVEAKNSKTLKFNYQGKEVKVPFNYNQNVIDFMASYPQADYDTYFDAPVENESYVQVASALKKYIDGKAASDAMNFVLSFVQHAFIYETDQQQFGREKPMFAEETLYYNGSDCEDRASLYAYLMKKLFNANIVGVKYSDHMTTAVHLPIAGDFVNVANERFVIADPTYINAVIGQSMPQYKGVIPETFIVVKVN